LLCAQLLITLPISLPAGAVAAFACEASVVLFSFFTVFTPLVSQPANLHVHAQGVAVEKG
jgi:hypothetical protein